MSCNLRVYGRTLDVPAVLKRISLKPYRTWKRGEKTYTRIESKKRNKASGASFTASGAGMRNFSAQVSAATRFLNKHKKDIRTLRRAKGLESITLDFGIELTDGYMNSDWLPSSFIAAAAAAGVNVELSHYPPLKRGR